jgi:hypothetical protein
MPPEPSVHYPKRKILEATVVAAIVAAILLVIVVLPAEYGIDPTGLGKMIGLSSLSQQAPAEPQTGYANHTEPYQTMEQRIDVPPRGELEFKFKLTTGGILLYTWNATAPIYYDFHGEPTTEEGKMYLPFQSFEIDTKAQANGFLLPPFTGTHGWYWRNDSDQAVTIDLKATGYFEIAGIRNSSIRPSVR